MTDHSQQAALYEGCALGLIEDRTVLEVRGADRSTFLHNLCTNDIKTLIPGQGCEAFFTNVQGKTLCHALLLNGADSILISTDPGMADQLLPHLDKYLIREDVKLIDNSASVGTYLLAGPSSADVLEQALGVNLTENLQHTTLPDQADVRVGRVPFAQPNGFFLFIPDQQSSNVTSMLAAKGAVPIDSEWLEVARIEAAFPSSGRDLTIDNLPQEIGRDELAISFTKGCYLGQETVARIDALGRVNKLLVSLQFEGPDVPPSGTALHFNEKTIGQTTSSCWSPIRECPIALGYVRREITEQKPLLSSEFGPVKVVA